MTIQDLYEECVLRARELNIKFIVVGDDEHVQGVDLVNSNLEVFYGGRRVFAIDDIGYIRGEYKYFLYYGSEHPFCDVEAVNAGDTVVVNHSRN